MCSIRSMFTILAAGCIVTLSVTNAEARHGRNHRRNQHCNQQGGYGHSGYGHSGYGCGQNTCGYSQSGFSNNSGAGHCCSTNIQGTGYSNTVNHGISAQQSHGNVNLQNSNSQRLGAQESNPTIQQTGFSQRSQVSPGTIRASNGLQTSPQSIDASAQQPFIQQPAPPQPGVQTPGVQTPTTPQSSIDEPAVDASVAAPGL